MEFHIEHRVRQILKNSRHQQNLAIEQKYYPTSLLVNHPTVVNNNQVNLSTTKKSNVTFKSDEKKQKENNMPILDNKTNDDNLEQNNKNEFKNNVIPNRTFLFATNNLEVEPSIKNLTSYNNNKNEVNKTESKTSDKLESSKLEKNNFVQTTSQTTTELNKNNKSENLDLGIRPYNSMTQNNDNYNRMLELLKRPQYYISSTSSSSDDENIGQTNALTTTTKPAILQSETTTRPEQQNQWQINNENKNLTSKIQDEKDSDSDFFD